MRTVEGNSEPVPLAVGDRVWASATGFLDPGKPWAVGILCEIYLMEDGRTFYSIGPKVGKPWPNATFDNATKVSKSSAQRIVRTMRRARRRPLFDQIWTFLIDEAIRKKS